MPRLPTYQSCGDGSACLRLIALSIGVAAVLGGCERGGAAAPPAGTVAVPSAKPGPGIASSASVPARKTLAAEPETPADQWVNGKPVVARGKISKTPWQHLVGAVAGKQAEYFDLEQGGQTIIYVATVPSCPGSIEVRGVVHEVRGPSKRPGQPPSKVDDTYSELHIDVSSHRCMP